MKNTKTFVTVLAAALLAAVMVFTSCSQPTDGDPGSPGGSGSPGGVVLSGTVTAADLAAVFAVSPTAILGSTAETVYGEIPAGKTLIVAGDAAVAEDATLDVQGTLEIRSGAALNASGLTGVGTLVFSTGGTVLSNGTIQVDLAQAAKLADITGNGTKAVGLANFDGLGSLTVPSVYITGGTVNASTVQTYLGTAGRTLYLGGAVTGSSVLDLSNKPGNLVIDESGSYTASANLTASSAGNIIVKGTLSVGAVTLAGKFDLTEGELEVTGTVTGDHTFVDNKIKTLSSDTTAATIALTGVTRIDTVTAGASADLTISAAGNPATIGVVDASAAVSLPTTTFTTIGEYRAKTSGSLTSAGTALTTIEKVTASAAATLPASVTTVTEIVTTEESVAVTLGGDLIIAVGDTLTIGTGVNLLVKSGTTTLWADEGPTTYTPAGSTAVTLTQSSGVIGGGVLAGKVGITTTEAGYALTTAHLANLEEGSVIFYSGTQAGTAETLTIPAGVHVGSEGTLANITGLTLGEDARLTAGAAATFAALTALTLGEDARLIAPGATVFANLNSVTAAADSSLELGTWDFGSKAALILQIPDVESAATTITSDNLTVPVGKVLMLTGAAAPSAKVTVNGTLVVNGDSASLKLVDELTIGTGDETALALGKGSAITLGHANAKITGGTAYTITPESGKTDGKLTAGDTANTFVAFTAGTISGYISTEVGQAQIAALTNDTSALVLTFGEKDSELTIKADTTIDGVILDVATKGVISVDSGKKLTLALGAGTNAVGSGGIFTAEVDAGTPAAVVKANAATVKTSSGAFADAAALASAAIEKAETASANDKLATGSADRNLADGKIGKDDAAVTIEAEATFSVGAANAITVTAGV